MLLAYIDESYDKGEYWLTALLVPASEALALQRSLDAVVQDAVEKFGVNSNAAELHGYQLLHGEDDWAPMKRMIRPRIGVYTKALHAIAACQGVEIVHRGIDIPKLNSKYKDPWHPHRVALDFLLQSVNSMAKGACMDFLAIADEVDQSDTLRASYWDFQRIGTLSPYSGKLDRGVDALHFAPSKHSRLLQAADLVSYLHFRIRRSGVTDPRALKANAALSSIIGPATKVDSVWPA